MFPLRHKELLSFREGMGVSDPQQVDDRMVVGGENEERKILQRVTNSSETRRTYCCGMCDGARNRAEASDQGSPVPFVFSQRHKNRERGRRRRRCCRLSAFLCHEVPSMRGSAAGPS